MTVDEPQEAAHLLVTSLAPRIDQLCDDWDNSDRPVELGSQIAADNACMGPYQLAHVVALVLSHATDDLEVLREYTVRGSEDDFTVHTRPYAAYPLLRAAMENACTALWLMLPANREERVRRRFRLWITDGAHQDEVAKLMGHPNPRSKAKRRADVEPLAATQGISMGSLDKRVRYEEGSPISGVGHW